MIIRGERREKEKGRKCSPSKLWSKAVLTLPLYPSPLRDAKHSHET